MSEYTYKNVIIDPTSEDAESCLGKMVYFADTPSECLYHANNNVDYYMELKAIDTDSNYPFILENNLYCSCIILCKEDQKPKYVPFESANEFIDAYEKSFKSIKPDSTESILNRNWGIWIKYIDKDTFSYQQVTKIWNNGLIIGCDTEITSWKDVKDKYTFIDGTPCGK